MPVTGLDKKLYVAKSLKIYNYKIVSILSSLAKHKYILSLTLILTINVFFYFGIAVQIDRTIKIETKSIEENIVYNESRHFEEIINRSVKNIVSQIENNVKYTITDEDKSEYINALSLSLEKYTDLVLVGEQAYAEMVKHYTQLPESSEKKNYEEMMKDYRRSINISHDTNAGLLLDYQELVNEVVR